jgi:hypothetical protein
VDQSPSPVPVVVVEKVADKEPPSYGDVEPQTVSTDVSKQAADPEPDFETTKEEGPVAARPPTTPEVPRVVVEKIDNRLQHGDDFGESATTSQKVAHDMRAADAAPNELVVLPEGYVEPDSDEDEAAPLFRHESFQVDKAQSSDEVSNESSTENTSSEDVVNTPSEQEQSQGDLESNNDPLFSYETGSADGDFDELNNGPLLSHETGLNGGVSLSDEYEDELDAAPLLPHETGFSSYAGSMITTNSDYADDISEPRHYMYGDDDDMDEYRARSRQSDDAPAFSHEDHPNGDENYEEHDTPLLPHERDFAVPDKSSGEEDGFTLNSQPTFGYETDSARNIFGGTGRPSIFRKRTHSSSLPHSMPRTDAEDENLLDPSLERFPTSREHILDRVATIGLHLPEDQTMEDSIHSPVMSVLSQACSSVDLVPVKSYTSLASVPESDEDDEEANEDINSLPSPVVSHFSSPSARFARDPQATPLPDDSKRFAFPENHKGQVQSDRSTHSSEADSVPKTDGTKEPVLEKLQDVIASSNKALNPITPPLTPEKSSPPSMEDAAQVSEPQLRQRQVPKESTPEDSSTSSPKPNTPQGDNTDGAVKATDPHHLDHPNETFIQTFFRVVFSPVGRFLTACIGDRERAG